MINNLHNALKQKQYFGKSKNLKTFNINKTLVYCTSEENQRVIEVTPEIAESGMPTTLT